MIEKNGAPANMITNTCNLLNNDEPCFGAFLLCVSDIKFAGDLKDEVEGSDDPTHIDPETKELIGFLRKDLEDSCGNLCGFSNDSSDEDSSSHSCTDKYSHFENFFEIPETSISDMLCPGA